VIESPDSNQAQPVVLWIQSFNFRIRITIESNSLQFVGAGLWMLVEELKGQTCQTGGG
jgi:hypothetical protein